MPSTGRGIYFRLAVMMFLELFIWGAWLPLIFDYLHGMGYTKDQIPWILGMFNLAALVALFFSTQFADRNFAAEKFMAFSHLIGGLAMLGLSFIEKPADGPAPFWPFLILMGVHSLFYVPTLSIANSIAFANMKDPKRDYGLLRMWGTIGWIAAAWPFVFILVDWSKVPSINEVGILTWLKTALGTGKSGTELLSATRYTFMVSGIASLVLALFSLALPHTPPKPVSASGEKLAWLEAVKLLRKPFVLVLFVVTFLDAAIHQAYFYWSDTYLRKGVGIPSNWVMPIMSIGQVTEIVTMAFLGYVLKRLGWRMTMIVGILGHAGRFAAFAYLPYPAVAITVNILHGICYAFFFATVYIFIDEFFPKDIRSSAQGLFNFLILGAGPFVSNFVSGYLGEKYTTPEGGPDFERIFIVPCLVAFAAATLLLLLFHPPRIAKNRLDPSEEPGILETDRVP
jgi:MFS family permease